MYPFGENRVGKRTVKAFDTLFQRQDKDELLRIKALEATK